MTPPSRRDRVGLVASAVWQASPRRTVAVLVLTVLVGSSGIVLSLALRLLIDAAADRSRSGVITATLVLALAFGLKGSAERVANNLRDFLTSRAAVILDTEVLEALASLPTIDHLERPAHLDRVNLVRGRGGDLARATWSMMDGVAIVLQVIAVTYLLARLDPRLAVVPLAAGPALVLAHLGQQRVEATREATEELLRGDARLHELFTTVAGAQEMRIFRCRAEIDRQATDRWGEAWDRRFRASVHSALLTGAGWLVLGAAMLVALRVTVGAVAGGDASVGDLLFVWQLVLLLRAQTAAGIVTVRSTGAALAIADRFLWLRSQAATDRAAADAPPVSVGADLVLDRVGFSYPEVDSPALSDLSLRIPAGSTVAFVGHNGAGKTTVVKLLCKLYEPTEGSISYGGVDLADVPAPSWRAAISCSFQDHLRLEAVARESVGVGRLDRIDDEPVIERALDAAGGSGLRKGWRRGLATHLGKTYEAGTELSGGEWQKVAGARALMRPHPAVLIVDEPTAALDAHSEHELFERFTRASAEQREHGTITVLVSHRFSTVRAVDLIVVLEGGRVREVGSHDELLAADGAYAGMYRAQRAAYG